MQDYRYVFHYIDRFTRFSILRAIKSKTAEAGAEHLHHIWCLFGPPDLLQSDNGGEFNNAIVDALCIKYNVKKINGRAYAPQTQGKVERANQLAKNKLAAWQATAEEGADWVRALNHVQMEMNRHDRRSIASTPYKLVFNRDLSTSLGRQLEDQPCEVVPLLNSDSETEECPEASASAAASADHHDQIVPAPTQSPASTSKTSWINTTPVRTWSRSRLETSSP